ncbi:trabid-like protein [Aphelenchoides avenae]|nr:trabid-like protein [Aphelenchus avenae]
MAECSASRKWPCSLCTYLNYEASLKCTVCQTPRSSLTIEDAASVSSAKIIECSQQSSSAASDDRWSCPACTYLNCLRTKKCVQCRTDRPAYCGSDPPVEDPGNGKSSPTSLTVLAKELNKWSCPGCTFMNWPNAVRCTMCSFQRPSVKAEAPPISTSTNAGSPQRVQSLSGELETLGERLERLSSTGLQPVVRPSLDSPTLGPLEMYLRRYIAGSSNETLFFKAARAIGQRDLQMVNIVVEYLINEGNLSRTLTNFEARLLNACSPYGLRYEKGDTLVDIAKKYDSMDVVKLMKRVAPTEDKLPCAITCASRNRVWAKVAQLMALRNGSFNVQFVAQAHNFSIFKFPMKENDCNAEIMKSLFKPAPGIPPTHVYIDCCDINIAGNVVGRPLSVALKNRMGPNSLCDAVFQAMFGMCDRMNILRSALKYTVHRSSFKLRWMDRLRRMFRDCGLAMDEPTAEADWEETLAAVSNEDDSLEPIHIWALSHVVCRPILVVPMEETIDVSQLDDVDSNAATERPVHVHHYEGIYLPVLWGSPPASRSPLIIGHQNGLFYAIAVSDGTYQRDQDVHRYVRIRRPRRLDTMFRYLTHAELENTGFISQFISFGHSTPEHLYVRRDPNPFLYETLLFYGSWVHAVKCCVFDTPGTCTVAQLEREIDSPNLPDLFENLSVFSVKAGAMLKGAPPSRRRMETAKMVEQPVEPSTLTLDSDEDDDDP